MEKIKIIRAINKASQDYYDPVNNKHEHLQYLNICNVLLFDYFKSCLEKENKNKFLFSALTYKNESNYETPFDIVKGNHDETNYNFPDDATDEEKKAVGELLEDAGEKKEAISLTTSLLLKNPGSDFIFFNGYEYTTGESGIVNQISIKSYDLGKLIFTEDKKQFENDNADQIRTFTDKLDLNGDYTFSQYARYLWHYKRFQQLYYKRTQSNNFYVHFIRPSVIEFDYNLLLSLATSEQLEPNQLAFIDLLIYRIVSQTAIEKIKQDEEIERLRNVSASTHVIQTTIRGLFAPPLNSLLGENDIDLRILELQKAKNKFIKYAEVINLMSKLSSSFKDENEIKKSLKGSDLFTVNKQEIGDIKSVCDEIIVLRQSDPSLAKLTFTLNNGCLSGKAFVYANEYYPAKSFYELLLLTIIENVVKHGAADDGKLTVTMNLSEKEIAIENKSKPNNKREIRVEDMTGNFRVFHTILTRLGLGTFSVSNDNNVFKVTLKANEYE